MKNEVKSGSYRSLRDVYFDLKAVSMLRLLAKSLAVTPQGIRHKFLEAQFLKQSEVAPVLEVFDAAIAGLSAMRDSIAKMPTRLD